jgi:hypothetical protein
MMEKPMDALALFDAYMKVTGTPSLGHGEAPDPGLQGKTLGLINGSAWIMLWANWYGRQVLPGVKLVNVGNDAVQLNFMAAHGRGEPVPPRQNIEVFARYAVDLATLHAVDAILITCSTMNRAFPEVQESVRPYGIPVIQIDQPMMEKTVGMGERILAVATHGPTVENTRALLLETAERMGRRVSVECATVERAFHLLGEGNTRGHNEVIARAIQKETAARHFDCVVLAQLSMSVFALSYPDRVASFGLPVLTSGEEGFRRMKDVLLTGRV